MADYRPPLNDVSFVLDNLVDLDEICQLEPYSHLDRDTIKAVLEENARFVGDLIGPLNRIGDEQGSQHQPDNSVKTPDGFIAAYQAYVAGGWGAVPFEPDYGGGGFPWLVGIVMQEFISSANMAFSMCPLLTQGAIDMLRHHGSEEQKEVYLPKMVTGEWTGSMNLTEPEAGSDVGALRTKAVPADDGTWRISGTKIFISFGEHDMADNIIHLVLARTPGAPPGTKGISCFIVPKFLVNEDGSIGERNDVTCVSIEHKMGIKASPTCVMSYGEQGGAVGYLIGEENRGMRYMFTMMNNARLSVGLEGLALAERAYQDALQYAQERRQGTAPGAPAGESSFIIDHPDIRRMLMTMKASIEAMRGVIYLTAERMDIAMAHPDPDIRQAEQEQVDLLIPVCKAWSTDLGCEVTSLAIQVYGGMGYIEESGVPQHFRDARITPIYEGTNGIQAMDLVGRKLPMRAGGVVEDYLSMIASLDPALEKAGDELASIRSNLADALTVLADTTGWLLHHGLDDPRDALAGATPYLRMFSLVTGGWVMARQALAAKAIIDQGNGDTTQAEAKLVSARFFAEQLLPAVKGLQAPVTAGHGDLFAIDPACSGGLMAIPMPTSVLGPILASIPSPDSNQISLGPIHLRAYGLMIALGVFAAVEISRRRWRARGGDPDDISAIAIWAVPAGLIGARIYHVITDNELYRGHWFDVPWAKDANSPLAIWNGGLGIPGGIFLGVVVGVWVGYRRGMRLPVGLDVVGPAMAVAQAIGRLGNYFNQELYGRPTSLPWGLEISPAHRPIGFEQFATFQPTFLYEALWNLALAGLLVLIDRRRVLRPGRIFALYIGGYAVGRFLVESLRSDPANKILGLRVNTWTSLVTFAGVLIFLAVAGLRRRPGDSDEPYYDGHRWDREQGRIEPQDADGSSEPDESDELDGSDASDEPEDSGETTGTDEPESAGEQRS